MLQSKKKIISCKNQKQREKNMRDQYESQKKSENFLKDEGNPLASKDKEMGNRLER